MGGVAFAHSSKKHFHLSPSAPALIYSVQATEKGALEERPQSDTPFAKPKLRLYFDEHSYAC